MQYHAQYGATRFERGCRIAASCRGPTRELDMSSRTEAVLRVRRTGATHYEVLSQKPFMDGRFIAHRLRYSVRLGPVPENSHCSCPDWHERGQRGLLRGLGSADMYCKHMFAACVWLAQPALRNTWFAPEQRVRRADGAVGAVVRLEDWRVRVVWDGSGTGEHVLEDTNALARNVNGAWTSAAPSAVVRMLPRAADRIMRNHESFTA